MIPQPLFIVPRNLIDRTTPWSALGCRKRTTALLIEVHKTGTEAGQQRSCTDACHPSSSEPSLTCSPCHATNRFTRARVPTDCSRRLRYRLPGAEPRRRPTPTPVPAQSFAAAEPPLHAIGAHAGPAPAARTLLPRRPLQHQPLALGAGGAAAAEAAAAMTVGAAAADCKGMARG